MFKLTNTELDGIEQELSLKLPELYRRLLLEIGYGKVSPIAEIYHPSTVRELYEPFFDDPAQLFHPYFPFGCHIKRQELWIIDASAQLAASIWHETVPGDWSEEKWSTYDRWIETYLKPELRGDA